MNPTFRAVLLGVFAFIGIGFPTGTPLDRLFRTHLFAADSGGPLLTISPFVGGQFLISWPAPSQGYVLDARSDLSFLSPWQPVPDPPALVNDRYLRVISPAASSRFFRLRQTAHDTNRPPMLSLIGQQSVALGSTLILDLTATDPDGDALTFSASPMPLPAGATLNAFTGHFTFTPASNHVGTVQFTFHVSDGRLVASQSVSVTVPPVGPGGITAITGRILDTTDFVSNETERPIIGVRIALLGSAVNAFSDATGRFTLSGVPSGHQVLDLDASAAQMAPDGSGYAGFREEIVLAEGVDNIVSRPFFLPRLDASSLTQVNPGSTTVVMNTNLGITMTVPANTAKMGGTNFTGQLSISLVPAALAPAALPGFLEPGLLITIQPVGAIFNQPVPITFPNTDDLPPGSETDIWSLDAGTGQFVVVGTGRVTPDGKSVQTISGGVRAADWHFISPPQPSPGPVDDSICCSVDPDNECTTEAGSLVTQGRGSLQTRFSLPPVFSLGRTRALEFRYDSSRAFPFYILPADLTIPVRSAVPPLVSYQLSVGGITQGTENFIQTSGLEENNDETIRLAATFDGRGLPTGVYPFLLRQTSNYRFTRISSDTRDRIIIVNEQSSPFGAGWSLVGLMRLRTNADGSVLLVEGSGAHKLFDVRRQDLVIQSNDGASILRFREGTGRFAGVLVPPGAGGLHSAHNPIFGPDRNLYVLDGNRVLRFDGQTGEFLGVFVQPGSGGFSGASMMAFGPEGNLYAAGNVDPRVLRFSGSDGSFLGVAAQGNGIRRACGIAFGPDGLLYVLDQDGLIFTLADRVLRFNGATGQFIDEFVQPGNMDDTCAITFGPDGNIYIPDIRFRDVRRFSGQTGDFMDVFASGGPLAAAGPYFALFGPDGNLYVNNGSVQRFNGTNGTFLDTFVAGLGAFPSFFPAPAPSQIKAFDSPPGDDSTLIQNPDGSFTRRLKDGTRLDFNSRGLLLSVTDRNENADTYIYDGQDRLVQLVEAAGLTNQFTYAGSRLATITDPAGRIASFDFDTAENLAHVTLPDGSQRSFGYDDRHLMTAETDGRGLTTIREYNGFGRFVRSYLPDGSARLASSAFSVGAIDPTSGLGTTNNLAPFIRATNVAGIFTDGAGVTTRYKTGTFGELVSLTDSANLTSLYQRDPNGHATNIVLANGQAYAAAFDGKGNQILSVDRALQGTNRFSFGSPFNVLTSHIDPFGRTNTYTYDVRGNLTQSRSALGRTLRRTHDAHGLVTSITNAQGTVTTNSYDALGRLWESSHAPGASQRSTSYRYSAAGEVTNLVNALGQPEARAYDSFGRLAQAIAAGGRATSYTYDGNGNLLSVTPPGRPAHLFSYSPLNLVASYQPPALGGGSSATLFSYNGAKQLTQMIRPDGKTVRVAYDPAGRRSEVILSRGLFRFTYDPAKGNVARITSPDGVTNSYAYNGLFLTNTVWTGAVTGAVSVAHDRAGHLASVAVNGLGVNYTYDQDGDLVQAGNLVLTHAAGNGLLVSSTLGQVTTTWTYSEFGEVTNYLASVSATTLLQMQYVRDKLGRITQKIETIGGSTVTYAYMYNLAGELAEVQRNGAVTASYAYDGNGNRLTGPGLGSPPTYDVQDRLLQYGNTAYSYTAYGDLLTKTTAGQTTNHDYDELGNLLGVTLPGGAQIRFVIDGESRRVGRRVNGVLQQGFLYQDPLKPVAELNGANLVVSRFVFATRVNVPDYMIQGATNYRLLTDHLGSPRLVVNAATGAILQRIDYDEFGNVTQDTNPGFQPFGFAGGLREPATGLTRFGVRDYQGEPGRWTSKDPALFSGGDPNLYVYAKNDPINAADPTGRSPEDGPTQWEKLKKRIKDKEIDTFAKFKNEFQKIRDSYTWTERTFSKADEWNGIYQEAVTEVRNHPNWGDPNQTIPQIPN